MNSLKVAGVTGDEAEKNCDICDDTVDDSGVKFVAHVDGRDATFYVCEECFSNEMDITEAEKV